MEQVKIDAIKNYFKQSFEGSNIRDEQDIERGAVRFIIEYGNGAHSVILARDFFSGLDENQMLSRLKLFILVEHLQEMPNARLVVTLNGLEPEYQV
jgi:hypothetical protein